MKLLQEYLKIQRELYTYFDYIEDWVVIPVDDGTDYHWYINDNTVIFAEFKEQLLNLDNGDYYNNELYNQRFSSKSIYKGKDYTMIVVDTHTDGNKFLQIFDNSKQIQ